MGLSVPIRGQALLPVNTCSIFNPNSQHPISGFSGRKTLKTSLKLKCGGWDPHSTLPVRIP